MISACNHPKPISVVLSIHALLERRKEAVLLSLPTAKRAQTHGVRQPHLLSHIHPSYLQ